MTAPACKDCAFCTDNGSGNFNEFTCSEVVDPFTGSPLNIKVARQEKHPTMNFTLPCGYHGALFEAKE